MYPLPCTHKSRCSKCGEQQAPKPVRAMTAIQLDRRVVVVSDATSFATEEYMDPGMSG